MAEKIRNSIFYMGIVMSQSINWIKFSERMPNDDGRSIIRMIGETRCSLRLNHKIRSFFPAKNKYEWTPYTEEAWKELNK